MLKEIKYDKNGNVRPPNRGQYRPTSKVNETTEEEKTKRKNNAKKQTTEKPFHKEEIKTDNPYLEARRKRISK
jgi:hypothetical protein